MSRNNPTTFWARVQRSDESECWPWTGQLNTHGYGDCKYQGRRTTAHRIAFELHTGERLQRNVVVCHRCDNPRCCNPAHLFAGSQGDNVRDCHAKGRAKHNRTNGERRPLHKLTEAQVREIRASRCPLRTAAARYGVSSVTILKIRRREKWAHVSDNNNENEHG